MLRGVSTLAAFSIALVGPVSASGLLSYPSPLEGDAFYTPSSVVTGDVSLDIGWIGIAGASSGMASLAGRIDIPRHDDWRLEPDVGLATLFSPSETTFGGVVHIYNRLPQSAVGIFGGAEVTTGFDADFVLGAESEIYTHPNSIVGGQIAFVSGTADAVLVRRYWDYFFNPDLKATIDIEWLSGHAGGFAAGSAGSTKPFTGTQLSGFLSGTLVAGGTPATIGPAGLTWNTDPPATTQQEHVKLAPFDF